MNQVEDMRVLLSGGDFFESPRWRGDRWVVSDVFGECVVEVSTDGQANTVCHVPGRPSGIGWLNDGTMLVVSMRDRRLLRLSAADGLQTFADLARLCDYDLNDMLVVDDVAWVGTMGFDPLRGESPKPGQIFAVDSTGASGIAANGLWCANGMVKMPDGSIVVAESYGNRLSAFDRNGTTLTGQRLFFSEGPQPADRPGGEPVPNLPEFIPDGIAVDSEGGVWVADPRNRRCLRIAANGSVEQQIVTHRSPYACALGGPEGRTLLMCSSPGIHSVRGGRRGESSLLTIEVSVAA